MGFPIKAAMLLVHTRRNLLTLLLLRVAVVGSPGDDYSVTWIREHESWQVVTDRQTASPPRHAL